MFKQDKKMHKQDRKMQKIKIKTKGEDSYKQD